MKLELEELGRDFTVCRLENASQVDFERPFCFFARTDEEFSLVCPTENVPGNIAAREDGWRGFRIKGVLDFSLVGILSRVAAVLAGERISVFAVSTFNTDYFFVRSENYARAIDALEKDLRRDL